MKEKSILKTILIMIVFAGFIMSGLNIYGGEVSEASNNVENKQETRGKFPVLHRAATYLDLSLIGDDTYYPGDRDSEFYFYLIENYQNSEYSGADLGDDSLNNDNIFDTRVSIRDFMDEDHEQVLSSGGSPFSGFTTGYGSAYNGDDGFQVDYSQSWFATESGDEFMLNIKNSAIPGKYTLHVQVQYKIRVDYNNSSGYEYSSRTENFYLELEVVSGIGISTKENAIVYSPNDQPGAILYAGASRQKIAVSGLYTQVGKIGEIKGTLSYSGSDISVPTTYKEAYKKELDLGYEGILFWRIDVADNAAPGYYELTLSITYIRYWDDGDSGNDVTIIESNIKIEVEIAFTPILAPPPSNELTTAVTEFDQEKEEKTITFDVVFSNDGNVDLMDITVSLDLSNAKYFYTSEFYYDEESQAQKVKPGTEQTIPTLGVGSVVTLTFTVGVESNIPPGNFIVPINYDAKYFDTGIFGGSSIDMDTDEDTYHEIMMARGADEPDDKAYIYLKVEDSIIDMEARTYESLELGTNELTLSVDLQNTDGYDLKDLVVTIPYSSDLPIEPLGGAQDNDSMDPAFELHNVEMLVAGDLRTLEFEINVKNGDSWIGYHDITLIVNALNEHEEAVQVSLPFSLEIVPVPAQIVIGMVETPLIEEGEKFDLDITLINIGGSAAKDVTGLLLDNNNWFESSGDDVWISDVFDLGPGETHEITFKMSADKIDLNNIQAAIQNLSLRIEYKDVKGNVVRYSQTQPLSISLNTEDEGAFEQLSPMEWFYYVLWLIIIAAVLAFPVVFFKYRYIFRKKEIKFTEKRRNKRERGSDKSVKDETEDDEFVPAPVAPGGPAQMPAQGFNEPHEVGGNGPSESPGKVMPPRAPMGMGAQPRAPMMGEQYGGAPRPPMGGYQGGHPPQAFPPGQPHGQGGQRFLPEHADGGY